jgi:hypothetical protein
VVIVCSNKELQSRINLKSMTDIEMIMVDTPLKTAKLKWSGLSGFPDFS